MAQHLKAVGVGFVYVLGQPNRTKEDMVFAAIKQQNELCKQAGQQFDYIPLGKYFSSNCIICADEVHLNNLGKMKMGKCLTVFMGHR